MKRIPFTLLGISVCLGLYLTTGMVVPAVMGSSAPAGVLLHSTLDDAVAITSPVAGIGGTTTLAPADFVPAQVGDGAQFVGPGRVVTFPAIVGATQNVELDRGEIEFWYYPNYDAAADDVTHALVVIGDLYNVPRLTVVESDQFSLSVVTSDWTEHTASTNWRAPVWTVGQWVHVRAVWDTTRPTDSLQLYVNDTRVDNGGAAGGWNLGAEADIGDIFVGSGDASGDFTAAGIIDELIIHDAPQPSATATPTQISTPGTLTSTPTVTATPTTGSSGGITDPALVFTPAALPLQLVGTPFVDPVFGTTLRRVSNTSDNGGFETHIYSQLQAFSSDDAYLLLDGSNGFVVRRVSDLSLVAGLDTSQWNAPRWHPIRAHTLVHFDSNADPVVRLQFTDLDTLSTTTVFTFPTQYEYVRVNQSFDELSEDGRWLAGMVTRSDGASVLFALDLQNLTLGAQLPIPDLYTGPCESDPQWPEAEPDWVGVSPLGNYLVVQWTRDGTTRCSGLETFDLQTGVFVGRVYDGHQHGDLGVDSDGVTEIFMTFEMSAPPPNNDRTALGVRQLPGTSTVSPPTYVQVLDWGSGEHISCRGTHGACLVTGDTWDTNGWGPFEGELFLQYTDGSVLRLAHHRSSSCGYWVQPRASISRDGRYVVFASDWGQETGTDSCSGDSLGGGDPCIIDLQANSCGLFGDLNCDCTVNITDIMLAASRWPAVEGDPGFVSRYDLDGNGRIDVLDIMLVAVHWGETC